jgi:hypothetical protein
MSVRPANEFIFEIDLTEPDVLLLSGLGAEGWVVGRNQMGSEEALDLQVRIVDTNEPFHDQNGILTATGLHRVSLLAKLQDDPACEALRRQAAGGDAQAAFALGQRKLGGPAGMLHPEESARLFLAAYRGGVREAGLELACMPEHLRIALGFDETERVTALEALALDGDPAAALELLYNRHPLPRDRVIKVLRAVREGSAEARDWLERLEAEAQG